MSFVVPTLILLNVKTQYVKLVLYKKYIEQHFTINKFFIKWMINTLCNMFSFNFEKMFLVCGSYMSVLQKKRTSALD
jgi:hypothetical protein